MGCKKQTESTEDNITESENMEEVSESTVSIVSKLAQGEITTNLSQVDMTKWILDEDQNLYYQVGIQYCENPTDETYETLGIFVPAAYFDATDNGDGTYTCEVNTTANVGGYTSATAPVVIPVNTPGYSAMNAPTNSNSSCGYGEISDYTNAGFIVVFAGARGRDVGAPAGLTDFKAAIRYARYNEEVIPRVT